MSRSSPAICFICGSPAVVVTNEVDKIHCSSSTSNSNKVVDPLQSFNINVEHEVEAYQRGEKLILEHSVFVIKSLFQIPVPIFLEGENTSLISRDGNIRRMEFCDHCSESVEMARTIYGNFLEAMQIFRSIQSQLVEKVKGGRCSDRDGNPVLEKWRQFICNHAYGECSDPFVLEDCSSIVAKLLGSLQTTSSPPDIILKKDSSTPDITDDTTSGQQQQTNSNCSNVEMDASEVGFQDGEEEDEKPNYAESDFEPTEENEDFEHYSSSEEEKVLVSDENVSEEENDWKPEIDPLEIGGEDESSMSTSLGKIVSTRALRKRKAVPLEDSQVPSSDNDSVSGIPKKSKSKTKMKATDPKYRRQEKQRKRNATNPAPFRCPKPECFYSYFKKTVLLKHLEKDHNEAQLKFKCWKCNQSFALKSQLKEHLSQQHPDSLFSCHICPKFFHKQTSLNYHVSVSHSISKTTRKCDVEGCGKIFPNSRALSLHRNVTHNIKPVKKTNSEFKCTFDGCKKILNSERGLSTHLSIIHKIPSSRNIKHHPCPEKGCDRAFATSDWLKVHISRHKNEPLYKCKTCGEKFWNSAQLGCHNDKIHREGLTKKQFNCDICGKAFSSNMYLWNHRKAAHNVNKSTSAEVISKMAAAYKDKLSTNQFPCRAEGCGKIFKSFVALRGHMSLAHRRHFTFRCNSCDLTFSAKRLLTRHEEMIHISGETGSGKAFGCEICGKNFTSTDHLKLHRRNIHRNGKPSAEDEDDPGGVCESCGKSFGTKHALRNHNQSVHDKKYLCEECGKRFSSRGKLKHHMYVIHKIGTEEDKLKESVSGRKIVCSVVGCRKIYFGEKGEEKMKEHVREVHGEDGKGMPFVCEECGKGFGVKTKFEEHRLVHLNKDTKPFKCEMCGKGFATKGYLRYHQLNTHKAPRMFERKKETKPRNYKGKKK